MFYILGAALVVVLLTPVWVAFYQLADLARQKTDVWQRYEIGQRVVRLVLGVGLTGTLAIASIIAKEFVNGVFPGLVPGPTPLGLIVVGVMITTIYTMNDSLFNLESWRDKDGRE